MHGRKTYARLNSALEKVAVLPCETLTRKLTEDVSADTLGDWREKANRANM